MKGPYEYQFNEVDGGVRNLASREESQFGSSRNASRRIPMTKVTPEEDPMRPPGVAGTVSRESPEVKESGKEQN